MSFRKYRDDAIALIAYLALALLLTYPLILNFATHVPGDGGDDPALAWNLWWVPYSIINLGKSPIYTDYMFYPIGLNLAYYTLTYLNALLSIPLQYATNLVIATNANVLFLFAISGFGAYLLVKYLLRDSESLVSNLQSLPAFAAGALYAFSSNKFLYVSLGQFNIASSHWIPFYVLFLLKLTDDRRPMTDARRMLKLGFLLGLFLLFQALSEFIYASFLIIFTALYLIFWLIKNRFRFSSFVFRLSSFIVAVITFIIPMLPILSAMIQDMIIEGDFIQSGLGFADVFSTDVLGFFVPNHLHPIFGNLESQFHFAYINFGYLGFVALFIALVAFWKMPQARIWALFGGIFIFLTLGPSLRINGDVTPAPFLPFNFLLEIPFIKGNRYPSRWSVMVTLALAVMVGYGLAWLSERMLRNTHHASRIIVFRVAYFVILFALLFEHLSAPLPLSDFRIPDAYQTIAQDKGDFTVLELPLAWRNGFRMTGTLDAEMMFEQWYQTEHKHPILGGNTSRNPELKFQYFTEAPVINSLIAIETGHQLDPATINQDKQLAPDLLRFFGVRYIVWHSPRQPQNRAALEATRAYVQYVLPVTRISETSDDLGDTVVFRVNDLPPLNQILIQPTAPLARLNFAEGWGTIGGTSAWATRREAKMFVRTDTASDATISFRAFAPTQNQRMTLNVNGHAINVLPMKPGWGEYKWSVVGSQWSVGMNEIVLQFDLLIPASSVREGNFQVGKTGSTSPVSIVTCSAGSEVGDFGHIFVNGIDASKNQRGYNLVVVNEKTGAVESSAAFDTFASMEESARMAQFIDKIPNSRIVAIAVRDESSRNLTEDAVNALRSIGTTQDLRDKFRWSHAIIGVKGALPGSAQESASEIAPTQVMVGIGATEPNVAAAIEWIKIEPLGK
jgi:hypothetical protein